MTIFCGQKNLAEEALMVFHGSRGTPENSLKMNEFAKKVFAFQRKNKIKKNKRVR